MVGMDAGEFQEGALGMIPFSKPFIDPDCFKDILTLTSGRKISNGEACRKIEEAVAKISGADYAVACSSCSQAMMLGLGASGARGECYTQSFTWKSTAVAGQNQGSHVTLCDIDGERWSVPHYKGGSQRDDVAYAIAVDTFGMEYEPTSYIPVFFDRAHSLGVRFRALGLASFLSFSPSKILTGMEGGMILTNNKSRVEAMVGARDLVTRMPEANAIMIWYGLKHLSDLLDWKKTAFDTYRKKFPECQFQAGEGNHQVIGMMFPTHEQRDKVYNALKDQIEFKIYYEPLHTIPLANRRRNERLPITDDVYSRILCLPSWYKCPVHDIVEKIRAVME